MSSLITSALAPYPETLERWQACVVPSGSPRVLWRCYNLFAELVLRYSETHRAYHDLNHVLDCLNVFDQAKQYIPTQHHRCIQTALFYHDVVYDPERKDNETRSGELARRHLVELGWSEGGIQTVIDSIQATEHKGGVLEEAAKWVVDIDLSSLASRPALFDQNTKNIRLEYERAQNFTPDKWQKGRIAFAKGMLARERIFYTEPLHKMYEQRARGNLQTTVAQLEMAL
jgi:predicted metal-dependent HD superfamily phosphohydrolase